MGILNLFKSRSASQDELLILYGTKSGNAKLIAQKAETLLNKQGYPTQCKNMSGFEPAKLNNVKQLMVVVSTHGEGEAPPSAKKFFKRCLSDKMVNLKYLQYSICALGDSAYSEYCWAGKTLDKRFADLGAKSFYKRTDCEENFADDAIQWIKGSSKALTGTTSTKNDSDEDDSFKENESYEAEIIERRLLTSNDCEFPSYHLSLNIEHLNIQYQIGDVIELLPPNPEALMQILAQKLKLKNASNLANKEITTVSLKTLKRYHKKAEPKKLHKLLGSKKDLKAYLGKANLMDLLCDYPSKMDGKNLIKILPHLKGRKYSIASSQRLNNKRLDLTIKTIRYQFNERMHEGAASVFANETLALNSMVNFTLHQQPGFELPESTKIPIIMIGVSTGIAPFRAILKEREAQNTKGNTWLIWGNKHRDKDFLYQNEITTYKDSGVLEKLNTAFSCDGETKIHVDDLLKEQQEQLVQWISKGAHIYVCGSIAMGKSVYSTIENIFKKSNQSMDDLIQEGRYHEDVY